MYLNTCIQISCNDSRFEFIGIWFDKQRILVVKVQTSRYGHCFFNLHEYNISYNVKPHLFQAYPVHVACGS